MAAVPGADRGGRRRAHADPPERLGLLPVLDGLLRAEGIVHGAALVPINYRKGGMHARARKELARWPQYRGASWRTAAGACGST